ncbi:MAG TPA: hypothetical protein VE954_16265 [Oligoflexus sp.]|uniref:hypothetical protein n=1 Tax=Oligoflexus sp. TaxID=1971216 RepID=UPI002D26EEF7|nr:hypothetical protein [Oligoflexus sp.]HYX34655.1 hypothetical protein [Oligoflexus sp.]
MADGWTKNIFLFLNHEISIEDFEKRVYRDTEKIASAFGEDVLLSLVEFNYKCSGAAYDLEKLLKSTVSVEEYESWRVMRCLSNIIEGDPKASESIVMTYDFYCGGYAFMRDIGLAYGLCLQVPTVFNKDSWADLSWDEKSSLTEMMYPGVKEEAQKIINWLTDGSITLHGKTDDGQYCYEDHRKRK